MASNQGSHHLEEDAEEVYDRPRPRRRFRGLHWRHASQSHSSPPSNQPSPQQSPPQIRPFSVNMSQSGFGDFNTVNSSHSVSTVAVNPGSPTSYSYLSTYSAANG